MIRSFKVVVNGKSYDVAVEETGLAGETSAAAPASVITPAAAPVAAPVKAPAAAIIAGEPKAAAPAPVSAQVPSEGTKVNAPMPGTVLKIAVNPGDAVKKGDVLIILEAMKMENEIMSPHDGTVAAITVSQGANVSSGTLLAVVK